MKQMSNPPAEVTVSLQGSLETFALPDVLVLLASTKKDGELRVVGGRVDGRIWLEKGQIVHSTMSANETHPVDALFELLRLSAGTFNFESDSKPPRRAEPETIDLVLADAQVRLGEWNEIARVVPHLDAMVDMADEAPEDRVMVTREHWRLLRTVAGGRSVNELMEALGQSEFDTCKTVKELVDAGLASIDVDVKPKASSKGTSTPAAKAAAPAERESDRVGGPEPKRATPPADAKEAAAEVRKPAAARPAAQDQIEALAALASRPQNGAGATSAPKVRTSTSTENAGGTPSTRPTATKTPPPAPAVEEAKALVAQLAALSGDDEAAVAAKVTEHLASGGELPEVPDGDEPINRGLLLKFLSSVRN